MPAGRRVAPGLTLSLQLLKNRERPRAWGLTKDNPRVSRPLRSKSEEWFLLETRGKGEVPLFVRFECKHRDAERRVVEFGRTPDHPHTARFAWVQAPTDATHVSFELGDGAPQPGQQLAVQVERGIECDPKCHPLANTPRWTAYEPAFPIERVVLPASLESLREKLAGPRVEILARPRSLRDLAQRALGAACVIDPAWLDRPGFSLADLDRIVPASWLMVDLPSMARLVNDARLAKVSVVERRRQRGLMSARVEYADVQTRGFALQDVFPYGTLSEQGEFGLRAIRHDSEWKRYAAPRGVATVLASETPWAARGGDVLSTARADGRGELMACDLPWLVAGALGPLAAPRAAEFALRAHLGLPIAEGARYWTRWEDVGVVLRDIADMPRRFPPLHVSRWAAADGAIQLGVHLDGPDGPPRRTCLIRTGRADLSGPHDGLPPEPMMIFMRWLAREVSEDAGWARRALGATRVVWQFGLAGQNKYGVLFDSAPAPHPGAQDRVVEIRRGAIESKSGRGNSLISTQSGANQATERWLASGDLGLLGDASLDFQAELTARLRSWLSRVSV